ncbi:probable bifunctional dTTP/UTP pyrophosphatase/methyltransferase protein isoform X2 [Phyllostomus hastatus]|uniref:probable bifunctional dTTP/UTP pyrophosphatase/methyltransferase protein isoform X2 n=1 Tax=Phyllostomus hastatus TaxID=9423 RepID=UPI001E680423|nr:probable bifunctional dTTP/UTP pyrophosphatase/methyltransferase protein isoform X2 [Phyllostomus hastatus]
MVLYPVIRKLLEKRVVLASTSPRRQEILSNAGLRFTVVPSKFKENLSKASFPTPYAYAMETAKQKALEVARRMHQTYVPSEAQFGFLQKDLRAPDIVIGADTIVALEGLILEKPVDKTDAYSMLSRLSGKEHSVFTGVAIVRCSSEGGGLDLDVSEFYEETRVRFSQLSEELLWEYIHSGEPLDKAGGYGYGAQALGSVLVEAIHGDFLNVRGFPLNRFCKKLAELYHPPHPEDLQREKQDCIPAVATFDGLSDSEGAAPGQEGARGDRRRPQAQGRERARDADRKPTVESVPPTAVVELIDGYKVSKALFTACKMKLFDLLRDEGPLSALDVARKVDATAGATGRLLDVCVAFGLLDKTERGYSNTPLASLYLLSDSEHSLHSLALHNDNHTWHLYNHLESVVREGANPHQRALQSTVDSPFQESLYQTREKLQFMRAMHGLIKVVARQVATAFDLSGFTSACDLGGSTGALAYELARQYPGLKVTIFDLPEVIEDTVCFQPDGPQTGQVSFEPGDFFRDTLPEADLYIVCRILHDWPDDKVHQLLSRISRSCKPVYRLQISLLTGGCGHKCLHVGTGAPEPGSPECHCPALQGPEGACRFLPLEPLPRLPCPVAASW